jgi:hypothetical protein
VTVAAARFRDLSCGRTGLSVTVLGGAGETVHLTALEPTAAAGSWNVKTANVKIGSTGKCNVSFASGALVEIICDHPRD